MTQPPCSISFIASDAMRLMFSETEFTYSLSGSRGADFGVYLNARRP
jgi:hypothetical protein